MKKKVYFTVGKNTHRRCLIPTILLEDNEFRNCKFVVIEFWYWFVGLKIYKEVI